MVCCKSNLWLQRFAGILIIIFFCTSIWCRWHRFNHNGFFFLLADNSSLTSVSLLLLPVDLFEDLEDFDEEVDDVQVQLDGGGDVVFRGHAGHDHLGVENDEAWIEKSSSHQKQELESPPWNVLENQGPECYSIPLNECVIKMITSSRAKRSPD